jgi:hypothetical protein
MQEAEWSLLGFLMPSFTRNIRYYMHLQKALMKNAISMPGSPGPLTAPRSCSRGRLRLAILHLGF